MQALGGIKAAAEVKKQALMELAVLMERMYKQSTALSRGKPSLKEIDGRVGCFGCDKVGHYARGHAKKVNRMKQIRSF